MLGLSLMRKAGNRPAQRPAAGVLSQGAAGNLVFTRAPTVATGGVCYMHARMSGSRRGQM
jgi:hypothetical protein